MDSVGKSAQKWRGGLTAQEAILPIAYDKQCTHFKGCLDYIAMPLSF